MKIVSGIACPGGQAQRSDIWSSANTAMADASNSRAGYVQTALLLEQLLQIARLSALEEMASGIAHELNQPIGAITTFAQAARRMLDRPDPMIEPTVDVLQHISDEALKAGAGIRRIRGLFNGHPNGRVVCNVSEVLAELKPVLDLLATRWQAQLTVAVEPGIPEVALDRLRIQHVLFTLVQNALEAPTRDGRPPTVRIDIRGDRYAVQINIDDSGLGVAAADKARLFHPFFTTKQHGTGLGLASSRAIIEAHEGAIGVEDIPGGGTRFWLRLPAATRQDEES
jgi:C4-dicarboxylate-specific signal transduction histidine kinase